MVGWKPVNPECYANLVDEALAKETEGGVTKNLQERCEKIEAILTDLAQKCREDMPKVAQGEAKEEGKLQELL